MKLMPFACALLSLVVLGGQKSAAPLPADLKSMTKMNVRLMGPDIKPGSYTALPKLIYRAGARYARMEDAPDARTRVEKVTIIAEPDAYSIDLIDHTGTHAIDQGGANDMHLPMILPLDPRHRLANLDRLEFGQELAFFQKAGATKSAGPLINAKPTDLYTLEVNGCRAKLITREGSDVAVFVSWTTKGGVYKYEYSFYAEVPFDPQLFKPPSGIKFREMLPPAPGENGE
jgi:hypothetical protein